MKRSWRRFTIYPAYRKAERRDTFFEFAINFSRAIRALKLINGSAESRHHCDDKESLPEL